jgi:hypothetical protein
MTSFAFPALSSLQGMKSTADVSFILNRICKIGIITINENTFSIAESSVKKSDANRYFLYGGTKRFRTLKNSFIANLSYYSLILYIKLRKVTHFFAYNSTLYCFLGNGLKAKN